ncbi:MAG TPA: hypothetical protein VII30_12460, partial [Gemmatimonadaceae bacterium]
MTREILTAVLTAALWNGVPTLAAQTPPAVASATTQTQTRESPLTSARASQFADSILALMTLDEKLGQLAQSPGVGSQTGP